MIRAVLASVLAVSLLLVIGSDALAETDEELIRLIIQYENADKEIERIRESGDPNAGELIRQKEMEKAGYLKVLNRNNVVTEEQFEADRNGANIQIPAKEFRDDHSGDKDHACHLASSLAYGLTNLMSHCCSSPLLNLSQVIYTSGIWNW